MIPPLTDEQRAHLAELLRDSVFLKARRILLEAGRPDAALSDATLESLGKTMAYLTGYHDYDRGLDALVTAPSDTPTDAGPAPRPWEHIGLDAETD